MSGAVDQLLPKPPAFPAELVEECRQSKDFRPILFEWYKYVGKLCNLMTCLDIGTSHDRLFGRGSGITGWHAIRVPQPR